MTYDNRYIHLGGYRHRYVECGEGSRTILLLHGISCSVEFFEQVIPRLEGSFRILGLDLLGFGRSEKPRRVPYSLELYASLIREFVDKTKSGDAQETVAIGHSMGGKYAIATALLYPGTFSKLVLSNTDGFVHLPGWVRVISWPGIRHLLKELMTRDRIARYGFSSAFHAPGRIERSSFEKNLLISRDRQTVDTVIALNRNLARLDLQRTGLRQRLGELDLPILVLWGDHDQYISSKLAYTALEELPGSELYMFEACGHSPMLECPDEFSEIVRRFLVTS